MYLRGEGVGLNKREAAHWFRKAADQGDSGAAYNLGLMLTYGDGVPKDEEEGAKLIKVAADGGDVDAKALIARALGESGTGTANAGDVR